MCVCVLLKIIKNLFIIINNNSGQTPCRTPGTNRVCVCATFFFDQRNSFKSFYRYSARCPYPYTLFKKKKFLQQKGQRTSPSSHREDETYRSPFLRFLRNQSINKNKRNNLKTENKKYFFFFIFPSGERKRRNRRNYITRIK